MQRSKVSIIIPCRNEERYIGHCLESLLGNDYDKAFLEIVVVDGMSTDRTRDILERYCKDYEFIRIIDNPKLIKPVALNLGIRDTRSDVVMRIDAHAVYRSDYISKLVEGLYKYDADNIGGVRNTEYGDGLLSKAVGIVISHRFAAGDAYHRIGSRGVRKVDTVFCGCYRREVFDRIGLFNEKLIRTQDREFNARLVTSGGVIILDPSVTCTYFPRTSLKNYLKWNYAGAFWLFYARRFTRTKMTALRNVIPPLFVGWHLSLVPVALVCPRLTLFLALPIIGYWMLAIAISILAAWQRRSPTLAPMMVLLFSITHYSYGLGALIGFAKAGLLGKDTKS